MENMQPPQGGMEPTPPPVEQTPPPEVPPVVTEPFKSGRQRRWMFKNLPNIAKRWAQHRAGKKR